MFRETASAVIVRKGTKKKRNSQTYRKKTPFQVLKMGFIRHFSSEKTDNYRAKRNAHKKTATQADSGLIMYQPRGAREYLKVAC